MQSCGSALPSGTLSDRCCAQKLMLSVEPGVNIEPSNSPFWAVYRAAGPHGDRSLAITSTATTSSIAVVWKWPPRQICSCPQKSMVSCCCRPVILFQRLYAFSTILSKHVGGIFLLRDQYIGVGGTRAKPLQFINKCVFVDCKTPFDSKDRTHL